MKRITTQTITNEKDFSKLKDVLNYQLQNENTLKGGAFLDILSMDSYVQTDTFTKQNVENNQIEKKN